MGRGLETNERPIVETRCNEIPSAGEHQGDKGREGRPVERWRTGRVLKRIQVGHHQVGDRNINIMAAIVDEDSYDNPCLRNATMPWTA